MVIGNPYPSSFDLCMHQFLTSRNVGGIQSLISASQNPRSKKSRGKTDHRSLPPPEDYSGEQWSAKQVGGGSPICQHTSNDVSGKRLTKLFEKNGKIFVNSCKCLSKALSRADSGRKGYWWSVKVKLPKLR